MSKYRITHSTDRFGDTLWAVGLKLHMGHREDGEREDVFRLDGYGEYIQVTLKHSIAPIPDKE